MNALFQMQPQWIDDWYIFSKLALCSALIEVNFIFIGLDLFKQLLEIEKGIRQIGFHFIKLNDVMCLVMANAQ